MCLKYVRAALICIVLILTPTLVASAQGTPTLFISQVDAGDFPNVKFSLRAVDANNAAIGNLSASDIEVFENEQPVKNVDIAARDDTPINLIYVIDLGRRANYTTVGVENIQKAILFPMANGEFRENADSIAIIAETNDGSGDTTTTALDATQTGLVATNFVNSMSFRAGAGPTAGLEGVRSAIEMAGNTGAPRSAATAIIFVTTSIDQPAEDQLSQIVSDLDSAAHNQYVPIYVMHTDTNGKSFEYLEPLATDSGGQYLQLKKDTDQAALEAFYSPIFDQRAAYTVSFRSTLGISGTRTIGVAPAATGTVTDTATYDINLSPVSVAITSPAAGEQYPVEIDVTKEGRTANPNSITVKAAITPSADGVSRSLVNAELVVDGVPAQHQALQPGDTAADFTWNINASVIGDEANGTTVPHTFQVRVTDELGIQAESAPVTINLAVQVKKPGLPTWAIVAIALVIGLIMLVVVGGVVAFLVIRSRRGKQPAVVPSPGGARPAAMDLSKTLIAPDASDDVASLVVLEGPPDMVGEALRLTQRVTKLGRNAAQVDMAFFADTNSTVSSLHCNITRYQGDYYLTDNGSTNGTLVNNSKLSPNEPVLLTDGDEIVLGDVRLKGVKLQFKAPTAAPAGALRTVGHMLDSSPSRETMIESDEGYTGDETMIEGDDLDDEWDSTRSEDAGRTDQNR
jgi:hypothetical protein